MSTAINFSVQTREQFKQWIAVSLGWPLVRCELHDFHYSQAIDNATEEFTKWVIQEQQYYALDLSGYVQGVGYTLPSNVQGIFAMDMQSTMQGSVNSLFTVPNMMWNSGQWPTSQMMVGGGGGGWIQYEIALQWVELAKKMTGGGFSWEYNPINKILTLDPDPKLESLQGWIVMGCYTIRPEEQIYGESWCRRFALSQAKIYLGRIRKKIVIGNLMGGGVVDTSVLDEGLAEQDKLIEEIRAEYPSGVSFFIG